MSIFGSRRLHGVTSLSQALLDSLKDAAADADLSALLEQGALRLQQAWGFLWPDLLAGPADNC